MIPRRSRRTRRSAWANRTTRRKWRGCWWGCERKSSLSVSPEIVAARQDFFNHGWTRINTDEDGFSLIRVHPCSSVVGSYWLRLRRAALYRRTPSCRTAPWSGRLNTAKALPICNRRYGRLAICATLNRYPLGGERVPPGRVRGILHIQKFLRGYITVTGLVFSVLVNWIRPETARAANC